MEERLTRERMEALRNQSSPLSVEPYETGKVLNKNFSSVFTGDNQWKCLEGNQFWVEVVLKVLTHTKVDKSPWHVQIYPRTPLDAREEITGDLVEMMSHH